MAATDRRIRVGQRAARTITLTKKEVAAYAEITGDRNPLHFDEAFAARTKFGRLVVHGGLTAGFSTPSWRKTCPDQALFS